MIKLILKNQDKKDFSLFDKIDINIKNSSLLFGELLDTIDDCKMSIKVIDVRKQY
jgi:hypothetical protein